MDGEDPEAIGEDRVEHVVATSDGSMPAAVSASRSGAIVAFSAALSSLP
jgi:hypothetical protein